MNDEIGTSILNGGIDKLTDYEKIVNSMTKEDLVNASKEFLDLNKTAVTVLHPQSADKNSIENRYALSFTGNIKIRIKGDEQFISYIRMLCRFAEFSGIGIKTAIGMGQVRTV